MTKVTVLPRYRLEVRFIDGHRRTINIEHLLFGPVFEPLRDLRLFAKAFVDKEWGTVVWPNGADLGPEFLYTAEESPPAEG